MGKEEEHDAAADRARECVSCAAARQIEIARRLCIGEKEGGIRGAGTVAGRTAKLSDATGARHEQPAKQAGAR